MFVGWSTSDNATGDGNYKTPVYAAGSTYTLTADTTLYATWASTDVDAEFYIRLDGTIATEPQGHASSEYTGAIKIADAVSTAAFYANSTEGVGSHLLNQPTDDQIKTVCNAKGISYDPDTQYVLWYVIKQESTLHVDGVLLDRAKVNLSYNANAPAGEWANMPDGAQYVKDSTATVSSKVPTRPGYTFSGWNTAADGTGTSYASSADITMSDSVTLYAQWIPNDKTAYTVQWVAAGTGTVIKTVTRYAKTDVTASVTDADKTLAGYTYAGDSYAGTVLSGNVSGDGSLVLKLYFSTNITVTAPTASKTYDGTALTATTATLTAGTLAEGDTLVATATGSATNVSDSGTGNNVVYSVKVMHGDVDVTANYAITKAAGNLTITPATLTVTTPDATKAYDGGALTAAGTLSGLVTGETATFSTTGTQTNVGESTNGYDINWDGSAKQGNYTIDAHLGKLTVTSNSTSVTLTAPSDERTYDGTALTRSTGTTETGLPAGFTFEATVSGSQTDAGSSDNTVTGYKIYDASHNDVTGSFTNVKTVVGKLTVDRAKLTLTSVSLSKTYDGTALTNGTASLLEDGWVSGQGADYDFTGAQTESGSSANSFSYKAKSGTNLDNYDITKSEGALTVDPVTSEVVVTINGHSANATYDGASHSVTGYTVASISNSLYTANDFSLTGTDTVSAVDAGSYPMGLTAASFANTSKNYTNVRFVVSDGSLEVAKRAVTLTSATDTKVYDGTELKNSTVTVSGEGWATGEGATYDVTGAITSVGSTTNDFTYVLSQNAKSSNYAVTETLGTLTVTKADAAQNAVTVTPYAGTYDGSAHTVSATAAQAGSTLLYSTDGQTWSETAPTWTDVTSAQTVHVKATNPNYGDATADGTVTITPATLTVTTPDATKAYDGGALTAAGTLSGLVTGETATFSTTGTQTEAG
ncbi:MAG: InlB B-repeat-containing protein, partial [Atopobiaceae bacterium]|nr:InlB B-repeat-containing protein [Atopobiaceae bacterium]MDD4380143.1 InlB B-repeat-containing protein [Atopobiaceae bacterium]